jgi:hypothetical protein
VLQLLHRGSPQFTRRAVWRVYPFHWDGQRGRLWRGSALIYFTLRISAFSSDINLFLVDSSLRLKAEILKSHVTSDESQATKFPRAAAPHFLFRAPSQFYNSRIFAVLSYSSNLISIYFGLPKGIPWGDGLRNTKVSHCGLRKQQQIKSPRSGSTFFIFAL